MIEELGSKKLSPGRMLSQRRVRGLQDQNIRFTRRMVKIFAFDEDILDALVASLSPERIATYLAAAGGDREKAMRLYTWNTAVSAAFYGPLQGLEVALRNAMHRSLAARYGPDWYDDPACQFDAGTLHRIGKAKDELRRDGHAVDPPHVVAALPFGFSVALLGRGGKSAVLGTPKRNYEMTLWRPCLHLAFPHTRASRAQVHQPLDYLRTFRNRLAHHEPVFARHLEADYASILTVTGSLCPTTRDWIAHHSRIADILRLPKDASGMMF